MDHDSFAILFKALVLGIIEGITEFLPISSTGHLIVASTVIDFPAHSRSAFEIFIQLGAILAVVWDFRRPLADLAREAAAGPGAARALGAKILLAFVPAAAVGLAAGDAIEAWLFNPLTVGISLVVGGCLILLVERRSWPGGTTRVEDTHWSQALAIGMAQMLALVPGVSRAGATIIGGVLAGLDRPTATQFSFYLAMPTMLAASCYSLLKALGDLSLADAGPFAVGFVAAFVSAMIVVRIFLSYVRSHDFRVFGYYRIAVGILLVVLFG